MPKISLGWNHCSEVQHFCENLKNPPFKFHASSKSMSGDSGLPQSSFDGLYSEVPLDFDIQVVSSFGANNNDR